MRRPEAAISLTALALVLALGSPAAGDDPTAAGCLTAKAVIEGTSGPDFIQGTDTPEDIHAQTGDDRVRAGGGDDCISGADGNDIVIGQAGDDIVGGGNGNDIVIGGPGRDLLIGHVGADWLQDGRGRNTFDAGPGADVVVSRNSIPETVNCGAGSDTAYVDKRDTLSGCEHVFYYRPNEGAAHGPRAAASHLPGVNPTVPKPDKPRHEQSSFWVSHGLHWIPAVVGQPYDWTWYRECGIAGSDTQPFMTSAHIKWAGRPPKNAYFKVKIEYQILGQSAWGTSLGGEHWRTQASQAIETKGYTMPVSGHIHVTLTEPVPEEAAGAKTRALITYEWKTGDFARDTVKKRYISITPDCVPLSMAG